ncbi:MAG: hypothetical protein ABEJ35_03775 [Halobacteriaceae archaeon]
MSHRTDTISLVADETRAAILRELEAHLADTHERPSFTTLRKRVGMADSGQFNYHLGQLEGHLIEEHDDGYDLTPFGIRLAGSLFSGVLEGGRWGPVDYPMPCRDCGAPQTVEYVDGVLRIACEAGHEDSHFLPPGALSARTVVAAADVAWRRTVQGLALAVDGICPVCLARTSGGLEKTADGVLFRANCEHCPVTLRARPVDVVARHPSVVGFLWEQGIDVRQRGPGDLDWWHEAETTVVDDDPLRVSIAITADEETLRVTLGTDGTVLGTNRGQ